MLSYGLLYFGLTAICLALVYMFHDREESRYVKLSQQLMETSKRNLDLGVENKAMRLELNLMREEVTKVSFKTDGCCNQVDELQEHCAKLRSGQINLQDKVSRRRPVLGVTGPIQVEIYTPTKNLGKKKGPK